MPSFNCKWPTCQHITTKPGYCPAHADKATPQGDYDRYQRDRRSKDFYNSRQWQSARAWHIQHHPTCEAPGCNELAAHVHHIRPVKDIRDCRPELLTAAENLMSLCAAHHNQIEKRNGGK